MNVSLIRLRAPATPSQFWSDQQMLFTILLHSSQVPLVPLTPGASIFINVFLMMKLSFLTWIRFTIWIAIGKYTYS